jgi:hypothetical protein
MVSYHGPIAEFRHLLSTTTYVRQAGGLEGPLDGIISTQYFMSRL